MVNDFSIEDFDLLSEYRKKEILVDAHKVAEYHDGLCRYELFNISDFYVEVKVCFFHRYRKILNTYYFKDIPYTYAPQLSVLPVC
jgi:hypothetical protein